MKKPLVILSIVFFVWVIALQLLVFVTTNHLILAPDTSYPDLGHTSATMPSIFSLEPWQRFDATWYLNIAKHGYYYQKNVQSSVAFFPLYPIVVSIMAQFVGNYLTAAVLISVLCAWFSCLLLWYLTNYYFGKDAAWRASILYLLFPASFFLIAPYTESLFLFLTLAALALAIRREWVLAGICGLLVSATRLPGIIILIPVLWHYLEVHEHKIKSLLKPEAFALYIIPLGLLTYIAYLGFSFGDPLAFSHAQEAWQRNTELSYTSWWHTYLVWYESFLQAITTHHIDTIRSYSTDVAFLILFAVMVTLSFKKLPKSLAVSALLFFLIPLLSARPTSMPRYMLSAYPIFMTGAVLFRSRLSFVLITSASALTLALFTIMFTQGYWVA